MAAKFLMMSQTKATGVTLADRIHHAAKCIKSRREQPPAEVTEAIGDAPWFNEYLRLCLNFPLGNAILGAIAFGWQLHDEVKQAQSEEPVIYRA